MNKSALRNFATEARRELIEKVRIKALELGITLEDIKKETVQSSDAVFIEGKQLTIEEQNQRNRLIEEIKSRGYDQVIEEVAYTWFNRFTALRFMEVNEYLPTKTRVLSSKIEGSYEPDIIKEALNINLDIDKDLVYRLKTSNENDTTDRLYKYLIIKQCNALNNILPLMFEKILDYTELLFPDGLLSEGSFIRVMTDPNNIPENNWKNVEVLGWLYQYYISERKDEVFAGLRKNRKISKDDIAPATQLFTPHWIVRYMVENSVGKLWLEGHPNEELKEKWKYYIEEAEQEEEVEKELNKLREESRKIKLEDIRIIDPAMGSGHILVYAFDLLYDIYLSEGYISHEIPKLIIEKNIYGLDIDKRAFQLAYFALMMKGRSKSRRFFNEKVEVNICAIEESNGFPKEAITYFLNSKALEMERQIVEKDLEYLIDVFYDAKEYGSILKVDEINFDLIEERLEELRSQAPEDMFELQYRDKILEIIPGLVKQGRIMSNKYDAMITNPPYMGSRGMNPKLSEFVRREYPDTKADLFAVFMELDEHMVKPKGYMAMINQHSWMFLSSFEKYRERLLNNRTIDTMLHLGARAFEEIGGEVVQSTAFVNRKISLGEYEGTYIRLVEFNNAKLKEKKVASAIRKGEAKFKYNSRMGNFGCILGNPIAYWASKNVSSLFRDRQSLSDFGNARQGIATADNNRFLRYWHEVCTSRISFDCISREESKINKCKWFPYDKGGSFKKWFGNNEYLINWEDDGGEIRNFQNAVIRNPEYQFKKGITWSRISSATPSFRYHAETFLFSDAGPCFFVNCDTLLLQIMGYLNSVVSRHLLNILNPTITYQVGDIANLCYLNHDNVSIMEMVNNCIKISKTDWDSFETSWDFQRHPMLQSTNKTEESTVEQSYNNWKQITEDQFYRLKANEEELNRIFIEIYGLGDELTPEVEDKDITITKIVDEKADDGRRNPYIMDRKQAMETFISYAVGCILGRYSLDEEGLAYAGGGFNLSKYISFSPDKDNIVPILSEPYFEDDIVNGFVEFVKVVYGEKTLNENLDFIAKSLGIRNDESPRETIRRYFMNDFYKSHVQTYKKRPIYWLFTSGREKAFNALIYMHRYDRSTLARIRTDYLHVLQSRLEVERQRLEVNIANADNRSETRRFEKELRDLEKKIVELKDYDELLHHLADQMIEIDLDDGVKVNYEKFEGLVQRI